MRNFIAYKLDTSHTGHFEDTMSMHPQLQSNQNLKLFSVYATTLLADPVVKESFYSGLHRNLNTPANDIFLILGDFNASDGTDSVALRAVLARHGVGDCNDNEHLLLKRFTVYQLAIINTIFQKKKYLKTTWMHPQSKHLCLIYYVLVCQW